MHVKQSSITIRSINESDLPILEREVRASYGRPHRVELEDQQNDLLTFYVAWIGEKPVGTSFTTWTGPRDNGVRQIYPRCPEIYRLGVNSDLRSHGVGTQLIQACEDEARTRRFEQIGLGVALTNERAYRLYERLGYAPSSISEYMDVWQYQASDGSIQTVRDPLQFLIKSLTVVG